MKIYLAIKSMGSYDDYEEEPIKAFIDENKAKQFIKEYDENTCALREIAAIRSAEIKREVKQLSPKKKKTFDGDEGELNTKVAQLWDEYSELRDMVRYNFIEIKEIDLVE